jgi:hypothetical protein
MKRLLYALLGVVLVAGCNSDDDYDPTVPTNIAPVKGGGQAGEVGAPLTDSLTVIVTNLQGDPVEGVEVDWDVLEGGGALSASTVTTSATGVAQVQYTVGPLVGTQRVQALSGSLSGSPTTFTITARQPGGGDGDGGELP